MDQKFLTERGSINIVCISWCPVNSFTHFYNVATVMEMFNMTCDLVLGSFMTLCVVLRPM